MDRFISPAEFSTRALPAPRGVSRSVTFSLETLEQCASIQFDGRELLSELGRIVSRVGKSALRRPSQLSRLTFRDLDERWQPLTRTSQRAAARAKMLPESWISPE